MATIVQHDGENAASPATTIACPSLNVTAGNTLVVLCKSSGNFTAASRVTDSQGNTYALDWDATDANSGTNAIGDHAVYSCTVGTTGANVVTFNPTVSGRIAIIVYEVNGLGTHDGATRAITRFQNTTAPTSGTITPSAATGLIFAFVSANGTCTWETDFNNETESFDTDGRFHSGVDLSVTAAGQAADATVSLQLWDCGAIWYPDAGAAAAPIRRRTRTFFGVGR